MINGFVDEKITILLEYFYFIINLCDFNAYIYY